MDEFIVIGEYLRTILRNQIVIINLIGALTKETTGKIPTVSVEMENMTGGTSIIDVTPTIQAVKLRQEASDYFSLKQE